MAYSRSKGVGMWPFRDGDFDNQPRPYLVASDEELETERLLLIDRIMDAALPGGFFEPQDAELLGKSAFHCAEEIRRRQLQRLRGDDEEDSERRLRAWLDHNEFSTDDEVVYDNGEETWEY